MSKHVFNPAVIFDMDGVISDTQRLHSDAEVEALAHFGITCVARELAATYAGVSDQEMFAEILQRHGVASSYVPKVEELKSGILLEKMNRGIPLMPGIKELLSDLRARSLRLALASGAKLTFIHKVLSQTELFSAFQVVVSADEVPRGKPAPDIFIEAANRLEASPHHCLVIEDGYSGMQGARKAGMRCIGLVSDTSRDWPADVLVSSLYEISAEMIFSLLGADNQRAAGHKT
ncbi:MAG: HAD family phosphatase [Proteobacteria bacterium]|nr:HAD family phosphatase [Pseudomonadota bacterium]